MRFILIDPYSRHVWNMATPYQLSEDFFAGILRCDVPHQVELASGLDLWVSSEPKIRTFRLFSDGPQFTGYGILCGQTRLGDIKALPRWLSIEMISGWLEWPEDRKDENPFARRAPSKRPAKVNWPAFLRTLPRMRAEALGGP